MTNLESFAETIWTTVPMILVEQPTYRIRGVSAPAASLFGYEPNEMWGRPADIFTTDDQLRTRRIAESAGTATDQVLSLLCLKKDGTSLTVTAFLCQQKVLDIECILVILTPVANVSAPAQGARILVAEDNPVDAKLLALLLEPSHNVRFVATQHDVMIIAKEWRPDLVIMDIMLTGGVVDGISATRQLTALYPSMIVILCSGLQLPPADVRACGAAGAIWKPFDTETFADTVTSYLIPAKLSK